MKNQITISDVAKKAKVSKGAAWAALSKTNNNVRLAAKTKEHIIKVAQELNYKPNIIARGLSTRKSFLIGLFFNSSGGNWHIISQLIQNIQHICYSYDYSLIVYPSASLEEEHRNLQLGINRRLDGILTIPFISNDGDNAEEYNRISKSIIPVVQIFFKLCSNIPYIGRNYQKMGNDAVEYLIKRGHRKIGLMGASKDKVSVQDVNNFTLYQGYVNAMTKAGFDPKVYLSPYEGENDHIDRGYLVAKDIHSSSYAPTAIIAGANSVAYGAITYFKEHNVKVPGDISIVGCANDITLSPCMVPQLTHFPVSFDCLGKMAVQKCLNLSKNILLDDIRLEQEIEDGKTVCKIPF